jgi:hypothetical protein
MLRNMMQHANIMENTGKLPRCHKLHPELVRHLALALLQGLRCKSNLLQRVTALLPTAPATK